MSRSNLKKVILFGGVIVVIAAAVVLASNWYAVASIYRPTPSPKPVQLNYSNSKHDFSLKFPQYWSDFEPPSTSGENYIVRFTAPLIEGCEIPITITINAFDLPAESAGETLDSYFEKAEAMLADSASNYERVNVMDSTISGVPSKVFRWTMGDNEDLTTDQILFFFNNRVYVITYAALTEFHNRAYNGLELIGSTFRFNKTTPKISMPSGTP